MREAVVQTAIAPILAKPDLGAERTDEVLHGTVVAILEAAENGFYKIMTPYRYSGYVQGNDLNFDQMAVAYWQRPDKDVINSHSADILSEAKVQGGHVLTLTKGCFLIPLGESKNGYTKVATAQGTEGFIRTLFLSPPLPFFDLRHYEERDESAFRDKVIETACGYIGTQYRWGGKTPLGIDCSGLCFMSYFLNGMTIHRDSSIQEGFPIREIPREKMKKGDLIFFPRHVALYMGDEKYIHSCAANDGVYVNSLNIRDVDFKKDLVVSCVGSAFC